MKTVFEIKRADYDIKLEKYNGAGEHFRVTYGAQVSRRLDYGEAAYELGSCIMHALRLEGRMDSN